MQRANPWPRTVTSCLCPSKCIILSSLLGPVRMHYFWLAGTEGWLDEQYCLIFAVCAGWLDARVFADGGVRRSVA